VSYRVKELFATLQGEGAQAGRAAVFCRFSGCNLWSGREAHRATATCRFCDTDFVGTDGPGGGTFATSAALADAVRRTWDDHMGELGAPYVVCTGGEPLLQLDVELVDALHGRGIEVGIETNGTLPVPDGVDWVCVSPKAGAELVVRAGDELKVVHPQDGLDPEDLVDLDFDHRFLQPMDRFDPDLTAASTARTVQYCLDHPRWRLSAQTHKHLGIP
jgi:7-carboxy-7-deazaguanine synthase (Cx14CxxC type)